MAPFSIALTDMQIGFIHGFRQLVIYSRATGTGAQNFILRKIVSGSFYSQYCKLWVESGNLKMDVTPGNTLPDGYSTADQVLGFNSLDYGYFGNDTQNLIVGTGDIRYLNGAKMILYQWPTSADRALILTCVKDYELTIYRFADNPTNRTTVDIPNGITYNP